MTASDSLRQWRALGMYSQVGAHRLFVREAGDVTRPALLLVHGFPTASFDWHLLWPALAEHFHLVAPDLLGFGFSDKPRGHHYRIGAQADRIEQILREREIDRVHVLAHDLGDSVAQELLARHWRRCASSTAACSPRRIAHGRSSACSRARWGPCWRPC
jgi:pimeloyl-ACP methyl ester carboxylesterase